MALISVALINDLNDSTYISLQIQSYVYIYIHTYLYVYMKFAALVSLCMCIHVYNSYPCSLPDPVPLEKDSDGNPVRIDIPKPVLDDYITVSCAYVYICNCL